MKFIKVILAFIGSICILALTGCFFLPQEDEYLQPPLRAPDRIEYTTTLVVRGSIIDELRGTGHVAAKSGITVTFGSISGRLKALHFNSGQDVEEGDLLAEMLNDHLLEALERQEIYTRLAEIDFERYRRSGTKLDREATQLRFRLSEIDLEKAREAVEKTRIYSPITGRVVYKSNIRENDYIEPFMSLYSIADISQLNLRLSDDFASKVPLGAKVSFVINSNTYTGTVVQVPSLNPGDAVDKNVAVIEYDYVDNEDIILGAGFTVYYERGKADDAIVIQRSLLRHDGNRSYVILLENNVPVERNVVLGIISGSHAEILEGLSDGDLIIH